MATPGIRHAPASGLPRASEVDLCRRSDLLQRTTRGGREAALGDLVEQCLVADLENARCFGTIPTNLLEHLGQGLAFSLARAASSNLPQAFVDDRSNLDVPVESACPQSLNGLLAVGQHDQAANRILQLSHIAGPRVLLEPCNGLRQQLLLAPVLGIELREKPRG